MGLTILSMTGSQERTHQRVGHGQLDTFNQFAAATSVAMHRPAATR
jgi:hypothetical protein